MSIQLRFALAVFFLALIPAGWTLTAPWIAEDTAILGYVTRNPWWQDWLGPQYGVRLVSFWRPVISTAWGLQSAVLDGAPAFFRALNLALHGACAVGVFLLLVRLGVGRLGAVLGALATAFFPEQGGTVTWISGRTDLLGALGVLITLLAALSERWLLAALLAFLACAAKEFAFLLPGWVVLLSWARGDARRPLQLRFAAVLAGCSLAFLVRRYALGTWAGGYPAQLPPLLSGIQGCLRGLGASWHPAALLLLPLGAFGLAWKSVAPRLALAALGAWLLGVAPLYPLLADGHLEAQNLRLYFVADIAVALLLGATLARLPTQRRRASTLVGLAIALLGWRFWDATEDAREWQRAARFAQERELAARAIVRDVQPARVPVWVTDFPASFEGAYCLGFGLADRFRAPFEETPRPIWPWRTVSSFPANARVPRRPLRPDGSLWPEDGPVVSGLDVEREGASESGAILLDERVLQPDPALAPQLVVKGAYPESGFEVLVYTPLGYEAMFMGPAGVGDEHRLSLKVLMEQTNGVYSVASLLQLSADLGASRAYVELRVVDVAGELLAVSPLIELAWSPEFLALTLGDR